MLSNDFLKKMGFGKVAPCKDFLILTASQFLLLHRCTMAWPEHYESDDPDMVGLLEKQLVEQSPHANNRYTPTAKGVQHILPDRLKHKSGHQNWPEKIPAKLN